MPAYAYPIPIKRKKQIIQYDERHEIAPPLTIALLAPIVGDSPFTIRDNDEQFSNSYILTVHKNRLETDEEQKMRVNREKRYMTEYNKRRPKQEPQT